jgi:hypothetical protein
MRGGVTVPGESHLLGHVCVGIVDNHSQTQLAPAAVSEEMPVLDLGFFVESLTELANRVLPNSADWVCLQPTTVR